jgi:hypothetical protein
MRSWGLLLTPEETNVPAELAAVHRAAPFRIDAAAEPAHRLPEPAPLRMEATPPVYLRLRDAFGAVPRVAAVAPQLTPPDPLAVARLRY